MSAKAGREMDAAIAQYVMGWEPAGEAVAVYVEDHWTVHADSDPEGWMCYADRSTVFKDEGWEEYTWERYHPREYAFLDEVAARHDWTAEQVAEMRAKHDAKYVNGIHQHGLRACPMFSTDIAAAWDVVEKMTALDWRTPEGMVVHNFYLTNYVEGEYGPYWCGLALHRPFMSMTERAVHDRADTAPLAICKAALLAVGAEVPT